MDLKTSATLTLLALVGTITIVSSQMYPGDCDKYCHKSCQQYWNSPGDEFSRCVQANVHCDCSTESNSNATGIIIAVVCITILVMAFCCCYCIGGRGGCADHQSHQNYPVTTMPDVYSPTPSAPTIIQAHDIETVDIPPPSYYEAMDVKSAGLPDTFSYYNSSSNTPI